MKWYLFLDDLRSPDEGYILAKSIKEAINLIENKGFPNKIAFDHDLGDGEKSIELIKMIEEKTIHTKEWIVPKDFEFSVHSDNPPGGKEIMGYMNSILRYLGNNFQLEKTTMYLARSK